MKKKTQDWHRADVIAALKKRGTSLADVGRANGYHPGTLKNVFERRYPKGQQIVADAIGVAPEVIWPSRYI